MVSHETLLLSILLIVSIGIGSVLSITALGLWYVILTSSCLICTLKRKRNELKLIISTEGDQNEKIDKTKPPQAIIMKKDDDDVKVEEDYNNKEEQEALISEPDEPKKKKKKSKRRHIEEDENHDE